MTRSIDFENDWRPNSAMSVIRLVPTRRNEGQEENVESALASFGMRTQPSAVSQFAERRPVEFSLFTS